MESEKAQRGSALQIELWKNRTAVKYLLSGVDHAIRLSDPEPVGSHLFSLRVSSAGVGGNRYLRGNSMA